MWRFYFIVVLGFSQGADNRQGPEIGLLNNLERLISRDELKCLPRLLCEQAAGGTPGQLRALQVDTSSLFTLFKYLGIESGASPMLEMGRALMTGFSNRGDSYACYRKYPACPRDQQRLLHYLNNHRGGFFRGFSRPHYARNENEVENRIVNKAQSIVAIESEPDFGHPNQFPGSFKKPTNAVQNTKFFASSPNNFRIETAEEFEYFTNRLNFKTETGGGFGQNGASSGSLQGDSNFIFPTRNGKQVKYFQQGLISSTLPSSFSFPNNKNYDLGGEGKQFFPIN